ncbi:PREDICTED: ribonuclease T2 [Chrysochloris asiatica]|uniref:Ribonuclease T2 n=1 Tax=Chrysochloris asiatica TaxID=185453 RepID=A0A9B0TTR1_CHRAS|nr:PREDICTED: ribonuclease T2 [Chrysochloris asiatica]
MHGVPQERSAPGPPGRRSGAEHMGLPRGLHRSRGPPRVNDPCPKQGHVHSCRGWSSHEWKKLIMVHHWPPTVCEEVGNDCSNTLDYWTIHGLWPDKAEECNRSWHFNLEEIKDLMPEMKMYWPDVIHHSSNSSQFWRHEWEKHGTCAAQLEVLSSEKKYFGKSLELYQQMDLNNMLRKLGIKPSINYYQIADIKDALASIYGVMPKVQCLPPTQDEKVQTIGQIELCLTKDLVLRNCTEPGHSASLKPKATWTGVVSLEVCEDGPVFYPPPRETTRKPPEL